MEGGDFTGSAGWFPEPQVIHFTFLSGLLAAHTAAQSNYMDTKQTGKQDSVFKSPVDLTLSRLSLNHQVQVLEDTGKELKEQVNPGEGRLGGI